MSKTSLRNILISTVVLAWIVLFQYESIRYFYLEPFLKRPLPQLKFLFPPAGWIMFYNVGSQFIYTEVYGHRNGGVERIDPHDILATRSFGYDNIHRNVLSVALERGEEKPFCHFLERKFPQFSDFTVTIVEYPSLTHLPQERVEREIYSCR